MARPIAIPILVLLLLAPFAGALPAAPPPVGETDHVSSSGWWLPNTPHFCYSSDPVVGIVETGVTSSISHHEADGVTQYVLHLDASLTDAACSAFDLAFSSSIAAWPQAQGWSSAPISSACGATGSFNVYSSSGGVGAQMYLDVPAACATGVVGQVSLYFSVGAVHPSTYLVCSPYGAQLCVGATQRENPYGYPCDDGTYGSSFSAVIVWAGRQCDPYNGDVVYVDPALGFVVIEAREGSCTIHAQDWALGLVDERAPCPTQLSDALRDEDWGHVLP